MVVTDLREELVAYVNGSPYLRRELEMPSAALHHAGHPLFALSCFKCPNLHSTSRRMSALLAACSLALACSGA